jgi:hypothetical protein
VNAVFNLYGKNQIEIEYFTYNQQYCLQPWEIKVWVSISQFPPLNYTPQRSYSKLYVFSCEQLSKNQVSFLRHPVPNNKAWKVCDGVMLLKWTKKVICWWEIYYRNQPDFFFFFSSCRNFFKYSITNSEEDPWGDEVMICVFIFLSHSWFNI